MLHLVQEQTANGMARLGHHNPLVMVGEQPRKEMEKAREGLLPGHGKDKGINLVDTRHAQTDKAGILFRNP